MMYHSFLRTTVPQYRTAVKKTWMEMNLATLAIQTKTTTESLTKWQVVRKYLFAFVAEAFLFRG